jgi:hypothetical protein
MQREDKIAEVAKWEIDTDGKSTAPSCIENLLTDAENPINIPSTSQTVSPGTKKLVPLPDRVAQRYVNERESLLKSKTSVRTLTIEGKTKHRPPVSSNLRCSSPPAETGGRHFNKQTYGDEES